MMYYIQYESYEADVMSVNDVYSKFKEDKDKILIYSQWLAEESLDMRVRDDPPTLQQPKRIICIS